MKPYYRVIIHIIQILILFGILYWCNYKKKEEFTNLQNKKLKYFNLDLHISVIQDIIDLQEQLHKPMIIKDHTLSGHAHIMKKKKTDSYVVNSQNWEQILNDDNLIDKFYRQHFTELNQYDGFIITHTPSFILLYEKFKKPIIMVNSCRYENPFQNNLKRWKKLNQVLQKYHQSGKLKIVSNNLADKKYLELGTGIKSPHVPSLCLYTQTKYSGTKKEFIVCDNFGILPNHKLVKSKNSLGSNFTWDELYSYQGIIHFPYEISTMSVFEQYSANVPLFFPSQKYLKELVQEGKVRLQSKYSSKYPPELEEALQKGRNFDFWINRADFYDTENMKHIQYFESIPDLFKKLETVKCQEISNLMKIHNKKRKERVIKSWNSL
tara:strand:+ start:126 stop:1262 length:1137 start_codon:yes stop_codon:yes gene_type:complete